MKKKDQRYVPVLIAIVCTLGCGRVDNSKSPAVGTWIQKPNRKGVSAVTVAFKADGTGTETLGGDSRSRHSQAISWSEKNRTVTYKRTGVSGVLGSALGMTPLSCTIAANGKTMTWGERGQLTLIKQ